VGPGKQGIEVAREDWTIAQGGERKEWQIAISPQSGTNGHARLALANSCGAHMVPENGNTAPTYADKRVTLDYSQKRRIRTGAVEHLNAIIRVVELLQKLNGNGHSVNAAEQRKIFMVITDRHMENRLCSEP
jgi:hypothetical protein